jgi:hypothetical protein
MEMDRVREIVESWQDYACSWRRIAIMLMICLVLGCVAFYHFGKDAVKSRPLDFTSLLKQEAVPIDCILKQGETKYIIVEYHGKLWAVALPNGVPERTQNVWDGMTLGGQEHSQSFLYAGGVDVPLYNRFGWYRYDGDELRAPFILTINYRTVPS